MFHNFGAFNFEEIFKLQGSSFDSFGNDEIWELSNYFLSKNPNFELEKSMVLLEWHNLKVRLLHDKKQKSFEGDCINYILNEPYFQNGYEGVTELLKIYTSLPSSNAEVERVSAMNRIKTKLRNKLGMEGSKI